MNRFFLNTVIAVTLVLITSCGKELMDQDYNTDIPVVESYLFAGDSTVSINISKLIGYSDENDDSEPLEGLIVSFSDDSSNYQLTDSDTSGMYTMNDQVFSVVEGKNYYLSFVYKSDTIKAQTSIPEKPVDFELSTVSLGVEGIDEGEHGMSEFDPVEIRWENSDGSYYFLIIEYMESTLNFINENMEDMEDFDPPTSSTTRIVTNDGYDLRGMSIMFFGTYRIVLCKVNQEYADLFESINQSSQNLTDPLSNIENGWGIFTGLNSDTLNLEVWEM